MFGVEKKIKKAYNEGLRKGREQMKNEILKDLRKDFQWIGEKRLPEIGTYVNKKYADLNYAQSTSEEE